MYNQRKIGVIILAYNVGRFLKMTIEGLPVFIDQVYVIDDGSSDNTTNVVEALSNSRLRLIKHKTNQGPGAAIATGFKAALKDGIDIAVKIDGDGQMYPEKIEGLITPIIEGRVDYTKGERLSKPIYRRGMPRHRLLGNILLSWLTKIASGYWSINDPQCGFVAISKQAMKSIDIESIYPYFGYLNDILIRLNVKGFKVQDIPMPVKYGEEKSSIRMAVYIPRVSFLLLKKYFYRLKAKYLDNHRRSGLISGERANADIYIPMKTACILSNGCPESLIDSARVRLYLEENNWQTIDDPTVADLILFYSCGSRDSKINSSLNTIKGLQKKAKRGSQVIVWGCLPKTSPEALKQVYSGPTFGESDLQKLCEIIHTVKPIDEITANQICSSYRKFCGVLELPLRILFRFSYYSNKKDSIYRDPKIFYIKAQTGCLGQCTYCVSRFSRGKTKSKSIDKVMAEFRTGLSQGHKTFVLLGTDLSTYGRDSGCTLVDLLREMVGEGGEYRIGLRNLNPGFLNQMLSDLEPVFATGKIWHAEIPVESGSNRILKLMGRPYTAETFEENIRRLKRACPSLKVKTHIMVGFPTETNQDFQKTMRLIDELKCDFIDVYRFTPHAGTEAATMPGRIHGRIAWFRVYRIVVKIAFDWMLKLLRISRYCKKTNRFFKAEKYYKN